MGQHGVEIRRLGHAFYRIATPGGKVVLIDPWVSGNPSLHKDWQDASRYADADYVLLTHGHFDHVLGTEEVMGAATNATLIAQFELIMVFLGKGIERVIPTNIGSTIELDGIKVSAVLATHSSSMQNPDTGELMYRGTPMGYVIEMENGFKVYAAGDTGMHSDMKFVVADYFAPDLAILPCDGLLTMSADQAAHAAGILGVSHVIPGHDFPSPSDEFPNMAPTLESYGFMRKMLDKRGNLARLIGEKHPDIAVHVLDHGDAVEL